MGDLKSIECRRALDALLETLEPDLDLQKSYALPLLYRYRDAVNDPDHSIHRYPETRYVDIDDIIDRVENASSLEEIRAALEYPLAAAYVPLYFLAPKFEVVTNVEFIHYTSEVAAKRIVRDGFIGRLTPSKMTMTRAVWDFSALNKGYIFAYESEYTKGGGWTIVRHNHGVRGFASHALRFNFVPDEDEQQLIIPVPCILDMEYVDMKRHNPIPKAWGVGAPFKFTNQSSPNENLDGNIIRGADLSKSNLRGSSFRGTDLTGTNLSGCDLRDCDFTAAILDKAVLGGALVDGAIFDNCSVDQTILFDPAKIASVEYFNPSNFRRIAGFSIDDNVANEYGDQLKALRESDNPDIINQYIELVLSLSGYDTEDLPLNSAIVKMPYGFTLLYLDRLQGLSLEGAVIRDVDFGNADLRGVDFSDSRIVGKTDMRSADVRGAIFEMSEFYEPDPNFDYEGDVGWDRLDEVLTPDQVKQVIGIHACGAPGGCPDRYHTTWDKMYESVVDNQGNEADLCRECSVYHECGDMVWYGWVDKYGRCPSCDEYMD